VSDLLRERIEAALTLALDGEEPPFIRPAVDAVTKVAQEAVDEMEGQWSDLADGYLGRIKEAERRAEELGRLHDKLADSLIEERKRHHETVALMVNLREALDRAYMFIRHVSPDCPGTGKNQESCECGFSQCYLIVRKALSLPAGAALAAHDAAIWREARERLERWGSRDNQDSHKMTPEQRIGFSLAVIKMQALDRGAEGGTDGR
jgi:hypothetical protein